MSILVASPRPHSLGRISLLTVFMVLAGSYAAGSYFNSRIEADNQKTYVAGISYKTPSGAMRTFTKQGKGQSSCTAFFLQFHRQTRVDSNPVGACADTTNNNPAVYRNLKNRTNTPAPTDPRVVALKARLAR